LSWLQAATETKVVEVNSNAKTNSAARRCRCLPTVAN
jgi:hypothetical protein